MLRAKKAVDKITKNDIRMIKALNNPPKNVKMVMTGVIHMMEGKELEWKKI